MLRQSERSSRISVSIFCRLLERLHHDFRVRRVGDLYEVDLHLQVDPEIPVEAGHAIARAVKRRMCEKHPEVFKIH